MKKGRIVILAVCMVLFLGGCHEHVFQPATCVLPATCAECGETEGEALGHEYKEATCLTPKTCIRCGDTIGKGKGHTWAEATCTKPKTCTECGTEYGITLPHEYSEATCEEAATCVNCGVKKGLALGHDYSKGDCVTDQVCSRCKLKIPAPGHKFADASCTEPKTCSVCGGVEGEALGHDVQDGVCRRCKQEIGTAIGSLEYLKTLCGLKATCETDYNACKILIDTDHNPYDIEYDYGEAYKEAVEVCDWSLVFDADYYMEQFPMLAYLYHYDKDLLLEHFQTVGIHEGRQGNAKFNVGVYYYTCSDAVYKAFQKNYEGYYLYYMLHYDTEKNVNTINIPEGKKKYKQYKTVKTIIQAEELVNINKYRAEVDVADVAYNSELQAFANYRAYINVKENWDAHDWTIAQGDKIWDILRIMTKTDGNSLAENNVTMGRNNAKKEYMSIPAFYNSYYHSKKHYEAMVNPKYNYVGVSNAYFGKNNQLNTYKKSNKLQGAQFDFYLKNIE